MTKQIALSRIREVAIDKVDALIQQFNAQKAEVELCLNEGRIAAWGAALSGRKATYEAFHHLHQVALLIDTALGRELHTRFAEACLRKEPS